MDKLLAAITMECPVHRHSLNGMCDLCKIASKPSYRSSIIRAACGDTSDFDELVRRNRMAWEESQAEIEKLRVLLDRPSRDGH